MITLPDNIEKIGERVFKGCINLEKINLTVSNANYIIDNDAIYEKNTNNLVTYTSGSKQKNFIIKDGLKPGKYTLSEMIAPEGYELSTETVTFVVKEDGTVDGEIIMYNKPETIEVPNTSSLKL